MSSIPSSFLYQAPPDAALKEYYVNQRLENVQAPAAVIDLAIVKKNCKLMLTSAEALKVQFRAHVKTHKTVQLAKMQVGETGPVRLIVSTIPELEHMLPWLLECIKQGRIVDVLYGVPASPSSLPRLAKIAHVLGGSQYLSLMVDYEDTIDFISQSVGIHELWPGPVRVFIKIDTGYHRSGITFNSFQFQRLSDLLSIPGMEERITFLGLYSHLGHSYGFSYPRESVQGLLEEFQGLAKALQALKRSHGHLTLSVGATPTATAAQGLLSSSTEAGIAEAKAFRTQLADLKSQGLTLELHAGVYPVLDMQQLATHARSSDLTTANIGLRIMTEVASLYTERSKPEALIAAGSLVLGREPCKSYPGWGVVTPWADRSIVHPQECIDLGHYSETSKTGWIVTKVSQEHGILRWEGSKVDGKAGRKLRVGEKLMVWPNHACVAGSGFGWYLVVDSESGDGEVVRDVWVRCRGW